MSICISCQRTYNEPWQSRHGEDANEGLCPTCQSERLDATSESRVSVARVSNLAEAGFLANDLLVHDIDAHIITEESFNALAGRWTSDYYIQVAGDDGPAAAAVIRAHLAEDGGDESWDETTDRLLAEDDRFELVYWRPVALMVLAGVASFVLGQRFANEQPPRPQPVSKDSLPTAVRSLGKFVIEPGAGKAGHRLWYQPTHQCWYLETDRDGDGLFEKRERYRPNGARW